MNYETILKSQKPFKGMEVPDDIPQGDMPGDKVFIGVEVTRNAVILFNELIDPLIAAMNNNPNSRAVVAIAGGSGAGKTCVASLCTYYLNQLGIGSYTLSGDNYPRRIPEYNDAERLHIFRENGVKGLVKAKTYNDEIKATLKELQLNNLDSDPSYIEKYPWLENYIEGGKDGLRGYLGTPHEIRFEDLDAVLKAFKDGAKTLDLKRMGRTEVDLWYETKDFSNVQVIIVEWTHGNSDDLHEVDINVLMNSTPEETRASRVARQRDAGADSPFVTMVLQIEQRKLHSQAKKADIILSRQGEKLTYQEYLKVMGE